ncbi:unnamed protein product, partial [Mesorhabditis spiculigera]
MTLHSLFLLFLAYGPAQTTQAASRIVCCTGW